MTIFVTWENPAVGPYGYSGANVYVDPVVIDDGWSGEVTYEWTMLTHPPSGVGELTTITSPNTRATSIYFHSDLPGSYFFQLTATNERFSGSGIIQVVLQVDEPTNPPYFPPVGSELFVEIGGVQYVTGILEDE